MLLRCLVLAGLLLFSGPALADESDAPNEAWQPGPSKASSGYTYQVFSREGEGERFLRYQVRGRVEAPPDVLIRSVRVVASDPSRAPEGQTRRVVSEDPDGFVVYTHIDLPPLFSDRDIVTRGVASRDARTGAGRIDWRAIQHEQVPERDDAIRIERSAGSWQFSPLADGASQVIYESYIDLAGSLPRWLIAPMMTATAGATFEELAREALAASRGVAAPPR